MAKIKSERSKSQSKPSKLTENVAVSNELLVEDDYFPYCIVWTPLPIITWFVPIIGHTGVSNSRGIIYDFSDDFNVSVDNFAFGVPTKYYQFHERNIPHGASAWDQAIKDTSDHYARTRHSLFFNNCHEYIADVLNKVKYKGRSNWSQTNVWCMITFRSKYTGVIGFIKQWWPFTVILITVIVFLSIAL